MCCDNIRLLTARIAPDDPLRELRDQLKCIRFGTSGDISRFGTYSDEDGNEIVTVKAKGFMIRREGTIHSRTVVTQASSRILDRGGVKSLQTPYAERIIPTSRFSASGISICSVTCNDGSVLSGCTHYPYVFESPVDFPETLLSVDSVRFDPQGETSVLIEMIVRGQP